MSGALSLRVVPLLRLAVPLALTAASPLPIRRPLLSPGSCPHRRTIRRNTATSSDISGCSSRSLVSFGCLALSQLRLVQSTPWMWLLLPFLLFTILYYVVSLSVNAFSRDFDLRAHRRLRSSWRPAVYPNVDIFLPVCGEHLDVLKNTWEHVAHLAQHYQGVVTPYVLDDAGDQAVAAMAAKFGFVYHCRPNRGWFKKAGNVFYGFHLSFAEYILILDADFAPRPDLLNELLPYMERDRRIGIVQSPQFLQCSISRTGSSEGLGRCRSSFTALFRSRGNAGPARSALVPARSTGGLPSKRMGGRHL